MDGRAQAAGRGVFQRNVATVAACNIACNSKTQPARAAGILRSRFIQPDERLENVFATVFRNARPVIVHNDFQPAFDMRNRQLDILRMTEGV